MKNWFSIAFIVILLLNIMGFYGVFVGVQYQHNQAMTSLIDASTYDASQEVTIKVPLSIPYMNDDAEFERVDGMFQHEGEVYRLVKQQYANDTLTVVCVKDAEHKRIDQALSNYVKSFTDKATDNGRHSTITLNFIKDYLPQTFSIRSASTGWEADVTPLISYTNLIPSFEVSVVHPPERG